MVVIMVIFSSFMAFAGGNSSIEIVEYNQVEVSVDRSTVVGEVYVYITDFYTGETFAPITIHTSESTTEIDYSMYDSSRYVISVVFSDGKPVEGHNYIKN